VSCLGGVVVVGQVHEEIWGLTHQGLTTPAATLRTRQTGQVLVALEPPHSSLRGSLRGIQWWANDAGSFGARPLLTVSQQLRTRPRLSSFQIPDLPSTDVQGQGYRGSSLGLYAS